MQSRIKLIRERSGLNQDDFAARIKLTKNYVSLLETGKRVPSDRTISDICREFMVNESWFRTGLGGLDNMYIPSTATSTLDAWLGEVLDEPDGGIRKQTLEVLSRMKPEFWGAFADFCEELVNSQEAKRGASPEDSQQTE